MYKNIVNKNIVPLFFRNKRQYCTSTTFSNNNNNNYSNNINNNININNIIQQQQLKQQQEELQYPLTNDDLQQFENNGYLIKSNLIPEQLLLQHQVELRDYLKSNAGIDFGNSVIDSTEESKMVEQQEQKLSLVSNGFGGMINFYHGKYLYEIRQHENLYHSFVQLYQRTYAKQREQSFNEMNQWPNEYGDFDPHNMFMFINRCCFRVPHSIQQEDKIKHQKGTGSHLDCNPYHLFRGEKLIDGTVKQIPLRFWQPIQAFVNLTDTFTMNQGGFWTIPGFHKQCVEYFRDKFPQKVSSPTTTTTEIISTLKRGNAFDFDDHLYKELIDKFQFIPMKRGDVLFWDWRMPHHNDKYHLGPLIREVVYAAHLPDVSVNQLYAKQQQQWYETGSHPSYVAKQFADLEKKNYSPPPLSPIGQHLIYGFPKKHELN
ncbi:hypothetical protein CYY_003907 [Polysphondylium violaceum]|uniref:Phytanoyl-CoA dioxygenase n=1 Tax=Polysphondylium violaceum TaxID=133409 RepID=A0A8J4V898_9MYCE|nr:hypothetical protein CYY_003907 [Polysphondylium violaceum]